MIDYHLSELISGHVLFVPLIDWCCILPLSIKTISRMIRQKYRGCRPSFALFSVLCSTPLPRLHCAPIDNRTTQTAQTTPATQNNASLSCPHDRWTECFRLAPINIVQLPEIHQSHQCHMGFSKSRPSKDREGQKSQNMPSNNNNTGY